MTRNLLARRIAVAVHVSRLAAKSWTRSTGVPAPASMKRMRAPRAATSLTTSDIGREVSRNLAGPAEAAPAHFFGVFALAVALTDGTWTSLRRIFYDHVRRTNCFCRT